MRITGYDKVEDCFNGSSIYRYWFDNEWTTQGIRRLGRIGNLDHYRDFPRPFFRLRCGGMEVKGVEGEANCLVIFPVEDRDELRARFEGQFS